MLRKQIRFVESFLYKLGFVVLLLPAISAPFVTGFFLNTRKGEIGGDVMTLYSLLNGNTWGVVIVPTFLALILLASLFFASRTVREHGVSTRVLATGSVATVFVLSLVWVLFLRTDLCQYADSLQVDRLARALIAGDHHVFSDGSVNSGIPYLVIYPFQSGFVFLMAAVYALFGVGNQLPLQILNALFVAITAYSIIKIADLTFGDARVTQLSCLCVILFLPLPLSSAFVYGNVIGFGFAALSMMANLRAIKHSGANADIGKWLPSLLLGIATMACSLMVKSTFFIMQLAILITWVLVLIYRGQWKAVPVAFIIFFIINKFSLLPVILLEHIVGFTFGDGMPKLSWIAMGLQWSDFLNQPGWWNPAQHLHFASVQGDTAAQSAYAKQAILDSLVSFANDPFGCLRFFGLKILTEWLDPTYQTLYYASVSTSSDTAHAVELIAFNGSMVNRLFALYMDAYQIVLYVAAALFLFRQSCSASRLSLIGCMLLVLTFLGGFACYLIWEAKSIYILPFAALLIPFMAQGIQAISLPFSVKQTCAKEPA